MLKRSKALHSKSFLLSLILLFGIGLVGYLQYHIIIVEHSRIVESHRVISGLEELETEITRADLALHSYTLLKDSINKESIILSWEKVKSHLNGLKDPYVFFGNGRLEKYDHSIEQLKDIRFNSLGNSPYEEEWRKIILSIREGIRQIREEINAVQLKRTSNLEADLSLNKGRYLHSFYLIMFLLFSSLAITLVFNHYIVREFKTCDEAVEKVNIYQEKLDLLNSELEIQNKILKNAESISSIGSLNYRFSTQQLEFTDSLYTLLGHDPGSFPPSKAQLLSFVHPDDRKLVEDNMSFEENTETNSLKTFRIIEKKGNVKYIATQRRVIEEAGRKILIITFKDITFEILINKSLEEKNLELHRSNDELASFNQVASHDLQEPLRKIQTFISRIKMMEDINWTPTAEDYFLRIQNAAKRMQKLILDLLSFSKTSKSEKLFEKVSLQSILLDAYQEMAQDTEDIKVIFEYDELPNANVIVFQIKQLFVNLLDNCFKYRKPNSVLQIIIKNEIPTPEELLAFPGHKVDDLVKFSIRDNGIGFNQEYAENIFGLFQRLHAKSKFPGTGLGLAICKKIIHNHNGLVKAEGFPAKGAKFTVIFPKNNKGLF